MIEPNPNAVPTVYTVKQVAAILGLSENSVRAAIKRGEIPGRKIGKIFRIHRATFDTWLAEKPRPADPAESWS